MNTFIENPFEIEGGSQLCEAVFSDSYIFNMKVQQFTRRSQMEYKRAKHFSCTYTDYQKRAYAITAGGIQVNHKLDRFKKSKVSFYTDLATVE